MANTISLNDREIFAYARKLEFMKKNSLPNAVRNTLNNLAFDTKNKRLVPQARKSFTIRGKGFYKRFSRVQKSTEKKINQMEAVAGMTTQGADKTSKQAIKNQTQQQLGGRITNKTLITFDKARKRGKRSLVSEENRVNAVKVDLDTSNNSGGTSRQRFIQTVAYARDRFSNGAIIKHKTKKGDEVIFRVNSNAGESQKGNKFRADTTPLYSVKKGRSVKIKKKRPFTKIAAEESMTMVNTFFANNANFQINKLNK